MEILKLVLDIIGVTMFTVAGIACSFIAYDLYLLHKGDECCKKLKQKTSDNKTNSQS